MEDETVIVTAETKNEIEQLIKDRVKYIKGVDNEEK